MTLASSLSFSFSPLGTSAMLAMLPLPIFAIQCLAYNLFSPYFSTERKRAYILSVLSSTIMSLVSTPYLWLYLRHGLKEAYRRSQEGWLLYLGRFGVAYFGTYLFADLAVGYFMYRPQVGLLTGWIHHTCYIALMIYCACTKDSPIFLIAGVMEIPTFDLGISNLFPQIRHDLRFLISFLVLRIAFHFMFLIDCTRSSSRDIFSVPWMPTFMLTLSLALHVMWFKGGVAGYIRRTSSSKQKQHVAEAVSDTVLETAATTVDPTIQTLPDDEDGCQSDSPLESPEDSPLITPHTPSQGAVPLRESKDNSFFPHLPNLPNLANMPNLGHLPTVSIPQVNLPSLAELTNALHAHRENINFGFREAVKTRIGEQRDRFAELTGGRTLNLGIPSIGGLRRRAATTDGVTGMSQKDAVGRGDTPAVVTDEEIEEY